VIEFRIDLADSTTARVLGWQGGIPGVELTLTPEDATQGSARMFRGSVQGRVSVGDLPAGRYLADAARWLAAAELARLPASDGALGFVGRTVLDPATSSPTVFRLAASRKRSLVISEWSFNDKGVLGIGSYPFGGYLELFNNGDTTVFLDGLYVAEGWWASVDAPPAAPCSASEPYRHDSLGIWSRAFQRFPGTGRDHPLAPGAVAVIATDAIDHRPLFPGAIDLRLADFEFAGHTDADNPAVPNMVEESLVPYPSGHGLHYFFTTNVPFLSVGVDLRSLTKARVGSYEWARFPAEAIVDVVAIGKSRATTGFPECDRLVAERFDRAANHERLGDEEIEYQFSLSRRIVPTGTARPYLQHTRNSSADLERTPRSPGRLRN